jgi:hypothetical protein
MNKLTLQAKVVFATIGSAVLGVISTVAAHAQSVPTVGTSDIAAVGAPILTAMISNSEYVLITFGPPLFVILLVFAVFFAIYHRVKVGHWL